MSKSTITFKKQKDGTVQVDRTMPTSVVDKFSKAEWDEFCDDIDEVLDSVNNFEARDRYRNHPCLWCMILSLILMAVFVDMEDDLLCGPTSFNPICFIGGSFGKYFVIPFLVLGIVVMCFYPSKLYSSSASYKEATEKMAAVLLIESETTDGVTFQFRKGVGGSTFESDKIDCVTVEEEC